MRAKGEHQGLILKKSHPRPLQVTIALKGDGSLGPGDRADDVQAAARQVMQACHIQGMQAVMVALLRPRSLDGSGHATNRVVHPDDLTG